MPRGTGHRVALWSTTAAVLASLSLTPMGGASPAFAAPSPGGMVPTIVGASGTDTVYVTGSGLSAATGVAFYCGIAPSAWSAALTATYWLQVSPSQNDTAR